MKSKASTCEHVLLNQHQISQRIYQAALQQGSHCSNYASHSDEIIWFFISQQASCLHTHDDDRLAANCEDAMEEIDIGGRGLLITARKREVYEDDRKTMIFKPKKWDPLLTIKDCINVAIEDSIKSLGAKKQLKIMIGQGTDKSRYHRPSTFTKSDGSYYPRMESTKTRISSITFHQQSRRDLKDIAIIDVGSLWKWKNLRKRNHYGPHAYDLRKLAIAGRPRKNDVTAGSKEHSSFGGITCLVAKEQRKAVPMTEGLEGHGSTSKISQVVKAIWLGVFYLQDIQLVTLFVACRKDLFRTCISGDCKSGASNALVVMMIAANSNHLGKSDGQSEEGISVGITILTAKGLEFYNRSQERKECFREEKRKNIYSRKRTVDSTFLKLLLFTILKYLAIHLTDYDDGYSNRWCFLSNSFDAEEAE
ncbi:hypothetical protein Tco_0052723 [Tanacetum coccineum]